MGDGTLGRTRHQSTGRRGGRYCATTGLPFAGGLAIIGNSRTGIWRDGRPTGHYVAGRVWRGRCEEVDYFGASAHEAMPLFENGPWRQKEGQPGVLCGVGLFPH